MVHGGIEPSSDFSHDYRRHPLKGKRSPIGVSSRKALDATGLFNTQGNTSLPNKPATVMLGEAYVLPMVIHRRLKAFFVDQTIQPNLALFFAGYDK